jgi:hypothetical protein
LGQDIFDKSVKLYPFNGNRQFSFFARDKQTRSCAAISASGNTTGDGIQVSVGRTVYFAKGVWRCLVEDKSGSLTLFCVTYYFMGSYETKSIMVSFETKELAAVYKTALGLLGAAGDASQIKLKFVFAVMFRLGTPMSILEKLVMDGAKTEVAFGLTQPLEGSDETNIITGFNSSQKEIASAFFHMLITQDANANGSLWLKLSIQMYGLPEMTFDEAAKIIENL